MTIKYSLTIVVALFVAGLLFTVPSEANINPKTIAGMWLFDNDDDDMAVDLSGNGNDGTFVGGPEFVDGKFGNALEFNGVGAYVNCGNGESLDITEEITILAWVNFDRVDYGGGGGDLFSIAAKGYPDSIPANAGWWFSHDNRGNGQSFGYTCFGNKNGGWAGGGNSLGGLAFQFTNGQWYHLALTVGDDIARLYIDGVQLGLDKPLTNLVLSDTSRDLSIGGALASYYFSGIIDEFAVLNVELDEEDIQGVMNKGLEVSSGLAAVDLSGKLTSTWGSVKSHK